MVFALPQAISRRWLASPLAIWGKLPSHADFLRHRVSPAQAHGWQDWVTRVWSKRPSSVPAPRPRRPLHGRANWLLLEPEPVLTDLTDVPVGFVMPPGALAFSPKHCVQGVLLASEDKVGRSCPLIIFQQVAPVWLHRSWSESPEEIQRDMLYWLSRIAARTHATDCRWPALTAAADAIWQAHAPGWKHLLGMHAMAPARSQLEALVRRYCRDESLDVASGLQGVQRVPQLRWPTQNYRTSEAFWQQDLQGGYINFATSLTDLWRTKP